MVRRRTRWAGTASPPGQSSSRTVRLVGCITECVRSKRKVSEVRQLRKCAHSTVLSDNKAGLAKLR